MNHVEKVYRSINEELVITSTFEGVHSASSLHYANLAYDCRLPLSNAPVIARLLQRSLGNDYDVVIEDDHYHIEYDPE